jgi:riboflavin kinase
MRLNGYIQSGVGQGVFFTRLDWVVKQFQEAMGFPPYPGTLNVRIREDDLHKADDLFSQMDFGILSPDSQFCAGDFKKVRINGILAAAVFPAKEVCVHGREIIEIIAGCHIKDTFHLKDGDPVVISDLQETDPRNGSIHIRKHEGME